MKKFPVYTLLIFLALQGIWAQVSLAQLDKRQPVLSYADVTNGQYAFIGAPAYQKRVKLIPNLEQREKMGLNRIDSILGVAHFFLDLDLTTGFVHRYTTNFFNRLRPGDYVLRFTRSANDSMVGTIEYVHKRDLQTKDVLGKNIAFFRQWKLCEIDLVKKKSEYKLNMKYCKFAPSCACIQSKSDNDNPFKGQIPLWSSRAKEGEVPLASLNRLGEYSGGTAVIIWDVQYNGRARVMFMDVHGSIDDIISAALLIADQYSVDPHIAISDAGPFAVKIRADTNNVLSCKQLKAIAPRSQKVGAGFGYTPDQEETK